MTPAIRAEGLSKCYHLYDRPVDRLKQLLLGQRRRYYREFWALRDASFDVAKGEVLGVVGRNGAGKSTLLQMVCGTLAPTSGTLAVEGRIAALLELGAGFNPEFTGRENVILSASVLGLSKADIDARFEEIVDFSGIRDFIDQPVKFYSSGMYMRLAFAVATSVDPDILVIDEALSVGDGEFARKSFDRILLLKKAGATILFCSHSLYQVEAFCDSVLWLEHGRTVMHGKPQEVVQRYTQSLTAAQLQESTPPGAEHAVLEKGDAPLGAPAQTTSAPGYARFTQIHIALDGKRGREHHVRSGENTLTVEMHFDSDPLLPPPVAAVTLDYGTLLVVSCAVTRTDGVEVKRDATGRGKATITFSKLALRKGEYRVSVYLACENALHIYDHVNGAASLAVTDDLREPGLVHLPHTWTCSAETTHEIPPATRRAG